MKRSDREPRLLNRIKIVSLGLVTEFIYSFFDPRCQIKDRLVILKKMSTALHTVDFGSGFSYLVILDQSAHLAAKYLQFHSDWTSTNSLDSRKGNWFLGLLTTWSRKVRSCLRTQPHLKQLVLGFNRLMFAWSLKGSEKTKERAAELQGGPTINVTAQSHAQLICQAGNPF